MSSAVRSKLSSPKSSTQTLFLFFFWHTSNKPNMLSVCFFSNLLDFYDRYCTLSLWSQLALSQYLSPNPISVTLLNPSRLISSFLARSVPPLASFFPFDIITFFYSLILIAGCVSWFGDGMCGKKKQRFVRSQSFVLSLCLSHALIICLCCVVTDRPPNMPMAKKKVFELARGFYGRANRCIRIARMRVEKSLLWAYKGRKIKRRNYRAHFIQRINAGSRAASAIPYSDFMHGLRKTQIDVNRYDLSHSLTRSSCADRLRVLCRSKMLANLSVNEPYSFKAVVDTVRTYAMLTPRPFTQKGLLASVVVHKNRTPVIASPRPINFGG